jgi:hypothetical protein
MFLPQLALDLGNFIPLEQQAGEHHVNVDTLDTASSEDEPTGLRRPQRLRRQIRPAFPRAFDALRIAARYSALRNYICWTTMFSATLCTPPIFTRAAFMPMRNCQMPGRCRSCPSLELFAEGIPAAGCELGRSAVRF